MHGKVKTMAKEFLQRNVSYYDRLIKEAENSPHAPHYQNVSTQLKKTCGNYW
jgi:hypothetical protein